MIHLFYDYAFDLLYMVSPDGSVEITPNGAIWTPSLKSRPTLVKALRACTECTYLEYVGTL